MDSKAIVGMILAVDASASVALAPELLVEDMPHTAPPTTRSQARAKTKYGTCRDFSGG